MGCNNNTKSRVLRGSEHGKRTSKNTRLKREEFPRSLRMLLWDLQVPGREMASKTSRAALLWGRSAQWQSMHAFPIWEFQGCGDQPRVWAAHCVVNAPMPWALSGGFGVLGDEKGQRREAMEVRAVRRKVVTS